MPFHEEEKDEAHARMADPNRFIVTDKEYFEEQKLAFTCRLVNSGLSEELVNLFLAEKGSYSLDLE